MDIWHWFISFVSLSIFFSFCSESVIFPQVSAEMGKTLTLPWSPGREFGTQNSSGVWWAAFSSNPPEKRSVCVSAGCKITFLPHLPRVGELRKVFYFLFISLYIFTGSVTYFSILKYTFCCVLQWNNAGCLCVCTVSESRSVIYTVILHLQRALTQIYICIRALHIFGCFSVL